MKTMAITWNHSGNRGQMVLHMDRCFPCSLPWLRKLLRTTIDQSDHPEEYRAEILIYLNELLDEAENKTTREHVRVQILKESRAAEEAKGKLNRLSEKEKMQAGYVKQFVRRGDKDNVYRKMLEDTRRALRTQKAIYQSSLAGVRTAEHYIEQMDRDSKKIRDCLALLGQEV